MLRRASQFRGSKMVVDHQQNQSTAKPLSQVARFFKHWVLGVPVSQQSASTVEATMDVCELENRILYSGSPLPVEMMMGEASPEVELVSDAVADADTISDSPFEIQMDVFELDGLSELGCVGEVEPLDLLGDQSQVEELIFVDSGIASYEMMLNDLRSQLEGLGNTQIIVLEDVDGIQQITETLNQHQNIKALHLVTHGNSGAVELGNTALSNENIASYAGEIASWKNALSESADILFYGCNLGSGSEGLEFLEMITELTDAEVAGSDDMTGHASWMGDWELEINTGTIESELVFSESFQSSWTYTLAAGDALTVQEPAAEGVSNETVLPSSETNQTVLNESTGGQFQSQLKLQEGDIVTLGTANFTLNGTAPKTTSQYTVFNVEGGHFAFADQPDVSVSNFTQQEVKEGLVVFVDNADDFAPSYDISVLNPDNDSTLTASASIVFLPINDPAILHLSTTDFSLEQNSAPIEISGITISDSDGATGMVQVVISVESGVINLTPLAGVTVEGAANSALTVTGEIDVVSKSLKTLTYQPNADFSGLDFLEFELFDQATDSTALTASQIATATLNVQATDLDVTDEPDFKIDAPVNITIDGEGSERRVDIDLHNLFNCAGNSIVHPEPDFSVVEVTDVSLFRYINVTDQDTVRLVARASVEGAALVTVRITNPDGSVGEATFKVNVKSSTGEVLDDPRLGKDGYSSWLQRLLPEGNDSGSDVMVVGSSPCSEMSLVVVDMATEENLEDASSAQDDSQSDSQDPLETGNGSSADSQSGPAPISELIRSASEARWLTAREFGGVTERSEMLLTEHTYDFSSNFDYQDSTTDAEFSQFRFQVKTVISDLNSLTETSFSEVLEASSPLAFAALDDYSEQLNQTANHFGVAVAGSLISLSGLSIGVVTWVARNSAIVTSLMANMPTWQLIDPLIVLGGEDELNSGESVIDIISASETASDASKA